MSDFDTVDREAREQLASPETTERNTAQLNARARRAAEQLSMYAETGDPAHLPQAGRNIRELVDGANRPRNAQAMIDARNRVLSSEDITALPSTPNPSTDEERKRLQLIKKRLAATMSLTAADATRRRSTSGRPTPYLKPYRGSFELMREDVEQDLAYVTDTLTGRASSQGPDATVVPEERASVFKAYAEVLTDLVTLNSPESEQRYIARSGSVLGTKKVLERYCRDPDAIPQNLRAFGALFFGTLFAIWAVMDIRKKSLSAMTVGLAALVAYLLKNGSPKDFIGTSQFSRAARAGLDGEMTNKLQRLAVSRSAAYNYMVSTLDELTHFDKPITEETIAKLIKPTKKSGGRTVADPSRAIPEDIARLLLGMRPGDAAFVLKGIRSTARSKDRAVVSQFAEANSHSDAIQRDLQQAMLAPPPSQAPAR